MKIRTDLRAVKADTEADYIRLRIADAVWTLRHSQFPRHGSPGGYRSAMPDPIRTFWEAYEQSAPRLTRQRPNAVQIARMDETLPLFYLVADEKERAALFLRHIPLSWRKVGLILDRSHVWAIHAERHAINEILTELAMKVPARVGALQIRENLPQWGFN